MKSILNTLHLRYYIYIYIIGNVIKILLKINTFNNNLNKY